MIMFLRIGMLNVPVWEIALSIALLIGTIAFLFVFGSKIYRGGVLMYNQASSWKDLKRAWQLTKNEKPSKQLGFYIGFVGVGFA